VVISFFIVNPVVWLEVANATWLFSMLAIGPLLAVLSVFIAVIISSRVNDTRVAQQVGGLLVLPVVGFGVAQTAGFVFLSPASFIGAAVVLAAIGVAAYFVAVRLFQRDQILTRWR
jgi:ABC-2 type transport system permease protein